MPQEKHRRHAIQIVAQLPERTTDALKVLEACRELVDTYLPGHGCPTEKAGPDRPRLSLWWVIPPLIIGGGLSFLFRWFIPVTLLTPFSTMVAVVAVICGYRHALILSALAFLFINFALIDPFFVFTKPTPKEITLLGIWVSLSLALPWLTANLCRVRRALRSVEDRVHRRDLPGHVLPETPVALPLVKPNVVPLAQPPQVPVGD